MKRVYDASMSPLGAGVYSYRGLSTVKSWQDLTNAFMSAWSRIRDMRSPERAYRHTVRYLHGSVGFGFGGHIKFIPALYPRKVRLASAQPFNTTAAKKQLFPMKIALSNSQNGSQKGLTVYKN